MDIDDRTPPPTRTRRRALPLALGIALLLTACGGTGEPAGPASPDEPRAETPSAAFTGSWVLVDGSDADGPIPAPAERPVTLDIEQDRWGGTAHCNSYGGTVDVDGDTIAPQDVFSTEMACLEDELMDAERRYLDAFVASTAVALDGDRLVLTGPGTGLTYERAAPVEPASLEDTTWVLDALVEGTGDDGSVSSLPEPEDEEGRRAVLTFDGERLDGFDLCNAFGGPYELEGDPSVGARLRVGELAGDAAGCASPSLEAASSHLLGVLGAGDVDVVIDGPTLTLTAGDRGIIYRAED